jgi:hypothetical protein
VSGRHDRRWAAIASASRIAGERDRRAAADAERIWSTRIDRYFESTRAIA